jgi:hypothetical protein
VSGAAVPNDRERLAHATNNALQLVQTALHALRGFDDRLSAPEIETLHDAIEVGLAQLESLLVPSTGASVFSLADAVGEAADLATKRGAGVGIEITEDVRVQGDRPEVTRVLEELFIAASVTREVLARVVDGGTWGIVRVETEQPTVRPLVLRLVAPR